MNEQAERREVLAQLANRELTPEGEFAALRDLIAAERRRHGVGHPLFRMESESGPVMVWTKAGEN